VSPSWLWLYGPPGVGKSAIGFEVYAQLVAQGRRVAFVELDQIGMCMPAEQVTRSAAKVHNLLAMLHNFALAGVDGVVVSGDIAGPPMDEVLARSPVRPVLCRLRADTEVLVERLTRRESLQYAEASRTYDRDNAVAAGDLDVVTHPHGVADLAAEVLRQLDPWPPPRRERTAATELVVPAAGDAPALLVSGPRAVGKSTVAWHVFMRSVAAGVGAGYLDLEQLGFVQPSPAGVARLELTLANVAAGWKGLSGGGAKRLVLCGLVEGDGDVGRYRDLFPSLHVVALTATYDTLLERARQRGRRKEIWLPGDDLFGRDDSELRAVAEQSASFTGDGADVVLPTDATSAADVASLIASW
jgi:Mrp family chromosome partitioning ATPase